MTLNEIKAAVDAGKHVFWSNFNYEVIKSSDEYLIHSKCNNHYIGLTWRDGTTLNGREDEFFVYQTNEKIRAIEAYTESTVIKNDGQHFEMEDGTEWLVLDNDEANKLTREEIEDSLWAFNPDFIVRHMPNFGKLTKKQESDLIGALGQIQGSLCEDCNPSLSAIIEDMDDFVGDAIASDGRGHFLARYDEVEVELENGLYAYRID